MVGAVLTEPASPGAHAGVLFFNNDAYSSMSGHGVIGVATIALERGIIMAGPDENAIVFDTPAGTVRTVAATKSLNAVTGPQVRVDRVTFTNVPAFVLHPGLPVQLGPRQLRADIAYGGAFYAIVDAEAAGLSIDMSHGPELRRAGLAIREAVGRAAAIVHPSRPAITGLDGTIFTGPSHDTGADLRNAVVFADGALDRSPGGTGTSAVMAVIDAMGLLGEDRPFVHEGLLGTRFSGRVSGRTVVNDYPAIVTDIDGSAWITGEHTFFVDDSDPLKLGFRS
jgi:proline racemase